MFSINKARSYRIFWLTSFFVGSIIVVALILYALSQNINLFFTPTQIVNKEFPLNANIRVGGLVVSGSVERIDGLNVKFKINDLKNNLIVNYNGILPDLFREGQGIVALGYMKNNEFFADQVLAKHDENYMPPEVARMIGKN